MHTRTSALPQPFFRRVATLACVTLLLALAGCVGNPSGKSGTTRSPQDVRDDTTDQMWRDTVSNAQLHVFQIDGTAFEADSGYYYPLDVSAIQPLEDGHFYLVEADVTYLNGGVAGYVNYPETTSVKACKEVSPYDFGLPSLEAHPYGLSLIGDYAEGDVLFYEHDTMAVWKDGTWVYQYDQVVKLEDGRQAGVRKGVSADDVLAGVERGTLSCSDYFVLPPAATNN